LSYGPADARSLDPAEQLVHGAAIWLGRDATTARRDGWRTATVHDG
jgi:hypothetical protein